MRIPEFHRIIPLIFIITCFSSSMAIAEKWYPLDCSSSIPLTNGVEYSGYMSGPANAALYSCYPNSLNGPDMVHTFNVPAHGTLHIICTEMEEDFTLLLLSACDQDDCIASSGEYWEQEEIIEIVSPGMYYIVVDGWMGASGNYTLWASFTAYTPTPTATPTQALDCSSSIPIANNTPYLGDTSGGSSNAFRYNCLERLLSGPERVHSFDVPEDGGLTVNLTGLSADLALLLLGGCSEYDCLDFSDSSGTGDELISSFPVSSGTYYIVVDGASGITSSYTLNANFAAGIPPTRTPTSTPTATPTGIFVDSKVSLDSLDGYSIAGCAYDGTYIWLVDYNGNSLLKVDHSGNILATYPLSYTSSWGLTFVPGTKAGNLWYSSLSADKDFEIGTDGVHTGEEIDFSALNTWVWGADMGWDGDYFWQVFINPDIIAKIDNDGNVLRSFESARHSDERALAYDTSDDTIWYGGLGNYIYHTNCFGHVISHIKDEALQACRPAGLAIDYGNNKLIVACNNSTNDILELNLTYLRSVIYPTDTPTVTPTPSSTPTATPTSTPAIDCSTPVPLSDGVPYSGTTIGADSNITFYGCISWNYSGPEVIHSFTIGSQSILEASLTGLGDDLGLFLLGSCSEHDCIRWSDWEDEEFLTYLAEPGTYYLVVDGYDGAAGAYTITASTYSVPAYIADHSRFTELQRNSLGGLAYGDGYLWMADENGKMIYKLGSDFSVNDSFPAKDKWNWQVSPYGLAFVNDSKADTLWFSSDDMDFEINTDGSPTGSYIDFWSQFKFWLVFDMGFDGTYLWQTVVNVFPEEYKIVQMDFAGNVISSFNTPSGTLEWGLCYDTSDNTLWFGGGSGALYHTTTSGSVLGYYTDYPFNAGINGLGIDTSQNDLYVSIESPDNEILRIDIDILKAGTTPTATPTATEVATATPTATPTPTNTATPAMTCSPVVQLTPGVAYYGDTNTGYNRVEEYSCTYRDYWGKEIIHTITIPDCSILDLQLTMLSANLDMFLLDSCSEQRCLAYATNEDTDDDFIIDFPALAQTYFIVVDGFEGDVGTYRIKAILRDVPSYVSKCFKHPGPELWSGAGIGHDGSWLWVADESLNAIDVITEDGIMLYSYPADYAQIYGVACVNDIKEMTVWYSADQTYSNYEIDTDGNITGRSMDLYDLFHHGFYAYGLPADLAYDGSHFWQNILDAELFTDYSFIGRFDIHGNLVDSFKSPSGGWEFGMAYDPYDQTLWFGGWESGNLYHFTTSGEILAAYDGFPFDVGISGLAVDEDSLWAVVDDAQGPIYELDLDVLRQPTPTGYLVCTEATPITGDGTYKGNTNNGSNNAEKYTSCHPLKMDAPEIVYSFSQANDFIIESILEYDFLCDIDIFLLQECHENSCILWGDEHLRSNTLSAGDYYLVVDGYNGCAGDYNLVITFEQPLPTATPTIMNTATPTATATDLPSMTPTTTPTAVPSATATLTPTTTSTASPTATVTATNTPTLVPPSATPTFTQTPTSAPSSTPTQTLTATPIPSDTPTSTQTPTSAPSSTPTITPTAEPSSTPTSTPTITNTPEATPTPTTTATSTATLIPTSTFTATPTVPTSTPTATILPTYTPTLTPSVEPTPTATLTATPTEAPPPVIMLGGYMNTRLSSSNGGFLMLVAFTTDQISEMEMALGGQPLGVFLYDDGTYPGDVAGDGLYVFSADVGVGAAVGQYLIELIARGESGTESLLYPYLNSED